MALINLEKAKAYNEQYKTTGVAKPVQTQKTSGSSLMSMEKAIQHDAEFASKITAGERIGSGVKSILGTAAATPLILGETVTETAKAMPTYLKDKWSKDTWKRIGEDLRQAKDRTEVKNVEIGDYGKIDENSRGMKLMDKAMENRENVTKGMSGTGAVVADTLVGVGQYLPLAALALTPGGQPAALAAMGSVSAAQKAYDVAKEGGSAVEAYSRGAAAGTIEVLTEKVPLDELIDLYKRGGKPALKSIVKRFGIEPAEETISLVANYLADKNAGYEGANLTAKDIFTNAASALLFSGTTSAISSAAGRLSNRFSNQNNKTTLPETKPVETAVKAEETVLTEQPEAPVKNVAPVEPPVVTPAVTEVKTTAPEEASVGAAPEGFDPWSNFQNKKSEFFPEGANAARPVDVPTTDLEGKNIRKTASTAMGAEAIPDEVVGEIQNMVLSGKLSYDKVTDKASVERAVYSIEEKGFEGAVEEFRNAVQKGYVSKDLATLGQQLLINAANSGDAKTTAKLLSLYAKMETTAGQAVQAASILRKLPPDSQLYAIKYNLGELKKAISKKYGEDISVPAELEEKFIKAKDQDERNAIMEEIKDAVAKQIPSNWQDKWNAWRYLAMLGNPRTHARNVFGNAIFQPVRVTKDAIGTLIEKVANGVTGGKIERTKSAVADPALYKAALADWKNVKDTLSNGWKYNDNIHDLESRKQVFSLPILEKARTTNSALLEAEDTAFKKITYADALAKYLKANGVTAQQMAEGKVPNELLSKARDYAGDEALRATYQDKNSVSEIISRMGKYEGTKPAAKVASAILEGIMPFRRTPANILVRGLEYSPMGAAKGVYDAFAKVKTGEVSAAKAIDEISAGLTGTGLAALGWLLGRLGIVTAGEDENKEQAELDALTGKQNYALNLPDGTSYTLDWAAPSALPFFMGTEYAEATTENGLSLDTFLEVLKSASEPMLEMSMLETLNDVLDSVSYADNQTGEVVKTALVSYLNQAIPTLGGQIERIGENKRMSTYTDKTLPMPRDAQYAIGKASARIPVPGIDYNQIPYIDAWGREEETGGIGQRIAENLVSPGYISKTNETAVDKEIQRLLNAHQTGVVPSKPSQSIEVTYKIAPKSKDTLKKNLTAEEYVTYSKTKGQTSYKIVNELITLPGYKDLSNEERPMSSRRCTTTQATLPPKRLLTANTQAKLMWNLPRRRRKNLACPKASICYSLISMARHWQTARRFEKPMPMAFLLGSMPNTPKRRANTMKTEKAV